MRTKCSAGPTGPPSPAAAAHLHHLAEGAGFDLAQEAAHDHAELDVGLEQREPDIAQGVSMFSSVRVAWPVRASLALRKPF